MVFENSAIIVILVPILYLNAILRLFIHDLDIVKSWQLSESIKTNGLKRGILFLCLIALCSSCKEKPAPKSSNGDQNPGHENVGIEKNHENHAIDYDTAFWTELTVDDGFVLDVRYATENNFTHKQIYPCGRCFLRPVLARKIKKLQHNIQKRYGYSLKLFDCYRPRPAQQLLWDIVPDARYVTPPHKGSMHNKGLALDVTLVDSLGHPLDMGTTYDYFGVEAYPGNKNLPEDVVKNRMILLKLMEAHGLSGIRTEWWHFSLKTAQAPLDSWEWDCPQ